MKSFPTIDTLLFFGSFDPITIGHEALVQTALDRIRPKEVLVIPAAREGWGKNLTSFEDRITTIEIVIAAHLLWNEVVFASQIEKTAALSGITADTLHHLVSHGYEEKKMGLLMGTDWILSLPAWEEWEWMLSIAPAFVALRGDETRSSLQKRIHPTIRSLMGSQVFLLPEHKTKKTKYVSSTATRDGMSPDRTPSYRSD